MVDVLSLDTAGRIDHLEATGTMPPLPDGDRRCCALRRRGEVLAIAFSPDGRILTGTDQSVGV
jgi:hypothetical protein